MLYPRTPWVPISHLHLRYLESTTGEAWFSGSLALTPIYVNQQQARWFHEQLQRVCQRYDAGYYQRFKAAADTSSYLPQREEMCGIGGIVFDRLLVGRDGLFEELFAFMQDIGELFGLAYTTMMRQNAHLPYSAREKQWQLVRRSRYAECNLAVDQAKRFAREMGGRITSLLLNPPPVDIAPDPQPEPGSSEEVTRQWLRKGIDWLTIDTPVTV